MSPNIVLMLSRPVSVAVSYTHLDVYKRQALKPSTTKDCKHEDIPTAVHNAQK